MSEWIKVEDRLPESGTVVLVVTKGGDSIIQGFYKHPWYDHMVMKRFKAKLRGWHSVYPIYESRNGEFPVGLCEHLPLALGRAVTHWMPLPEIPVLAAKQQN